MFKRLFSSQTPPLQRVMKDRAGRMIAPIYFEPLYYYVEHYSLTVQPKGKLFFKNNQGLSGYVHGVGSAYEMQKEGRIPFKGPLVFHDQDKETAHLLFLITIPPPATDDIDFSEVE